MLSTVRPLLGHARPAADMDIGPGEHHRRAVEAVVGARGRSLDDLNVAGRGSQLLTAACKAATWVASSARVGVWPQPGLAVSRTVHNDEQQRMSRRVTRSFRPPQGQARTERRACTVVLPACQGRAGGAWPAGLLRQAKRSGTQGFFTVRHKRQSSDGKSARGNGSPAPGDPRQSSGSGSKWVLSSWFLPALGMLLRLPLARLLYPPLTLA